MRVVLALTACAMVGACSPPDPNSTDAILGRVHRSNAVLVCADGTIVGQDPVSRHFVFAKTGSRRTWVGDIAPGISPVAFCKGAA